MSGYCSADDLGKDVNIKTMVNYDKVELGSMVWKLAGNDERMVRICHGNDTEEPFLAQDNTLGWYVGQDEAALRKAIQQQGTKVTTAMSDVNPMKTGAAAGHKRKYVSSKTKKHLPQRKLWLPSPIINLQRPNPRRNLR